MRPSSQIKTLADQMAARRTYRRSPYVVFLGEACARAAGVPSLRTIAEQVIRGFRDRTPSEASRRVADTVLASRDEVWRAFQAMLAGMQGIERYNLLSTHYAQTAVPAFYVDLAKLAQAGYFAHILTTSIDNVLEKALDSVGMWREDQYDVVNVGDPDSASVDVETSLVIFKLQGDLASQEILLPEEIDRALESRRGFVKGELKADLIMIGYEFESEPVNQWLQSRPSQAELVWVGPATGRFSEVLGPSTVTAVIDGADAEPPAFFAQLTQLLASAAIKRIPPQRGRALNSVAARPGSSDLLGVDPPAEEDDPEKYLREQLRRSRAELWDLEQMAAQRAASQELQAQLDYQRKYVAELEAKLRVEPSVTPQIIDLVTKVVTAALERSVDPDTIAFLESQLETVKREFAKLGPDGAPSPNQTIVAAAISATLALAESLGPEVVDTGITRALGALAPTVGARRR